MSHFIDFVVEDNVDEPRMLPVASALKIYGVKFGGYCTSSDIGVNYIWPFFQVQEISERIFGKLQ
jgi:hypothetical protein